MSKHLFGLIVTPYGAAANNRGETEGNITTLQKLLWKGEIHTTVSAEAIRWAIRYYFQRTQGTKAVNRQWSEEIEDHVWQDQTWAPWTSKDENVRKQETFIDDDIMGFMLAEAASTDGGDDLDTLKKERKSADQEFKGLSKDEQKGDRGKTVKARSKELAEKIKVMTEGTCDKRRGALEVTRAISLSPFAGDITFNAKSGTKTSTSLYGTEVHATRYQYAFALTPESLRVQSRTLILVDAILNLSEVAGNQSRFLFDFSPDSVVFRWTDDFAPRILYGFDMHSDMNLSFPGILERIKNRDIQPNELFIGGSIVTTFTEEDLKILQGAFVDNGVRAAVDKLKHRIRRDLELPEK
ncbi:DevR family CRISPR-associated autoregulator [bacterium]|nr:DevR family CRISPR-associated autoregulator [bacterium]MCI0604156.1 DevR family CRISPR-associated autoregulator [bacterium]